MEKTQGVHYEECKVCHATRKHFDHPCPHCTGYGVVHKNGSCLSGVEGHDHLVSIGVHADGTNEVISTKHSRPKSLRFASRSEIKLSNEERIELHGDGVPDEDSDTYVSEMGAFNLALSK